MRPLRLAYLLKKFPRLSETFVLGEILGQEAEGAEIHVFSRRKPDDEPRHPELAHLRATVEVLPSKRSLEPWLALFEPDVHGTDLLERFGTVVRDLAGFEHDRLPALVAEALYLLRRTRELEIDHVHVHFATDSAIVAMILAALGGPTFSVTAHAKDIYRSTVDAALLDRIVSRSAFTVTVCDANVRHMASRVSLSGMEQVRRLYNGIDLEAFRNDGGRRDEAHVLSVGRLVEKKGFGVLVEALARLAASGVEFRATLVGEGEARSQIEAAIAHHGLGERVTLTGALDQDAVREHLRSATVLCLPCLVGEDGNRDALPTVLLEAQAAGVPIVSTPVTGIPEILDGGRAGILVPEQDPARTAEAVEELLANPARRAELSAAGHARAAELFDRRQAARTLSQWFRGVVSVAEVA